VRGIAPPIPPHFGPQHGRRRPMPRFCAAADFLNFAFVAAYGLNNCSVCPPKGRRRPTPRSCAAGAGGVKYNTAEAFAGVGMPTAKLSASNSDSSKVNCRER
jgi:hypothetical protein